MPLAGLEPARCFHHLILSQARLPIPPQGQLLSRTARVAADNSGAAHAVNVSPYFLHRIDKVRRERYAHAPRRTKLVVTRTSIAPSPQPRQIAAALAVGGGLTICGFLYFQYVLGYQPCPLCLEQRDAFYISVPLAVLLWLGANFGAARKVMIAGFVVIALAMIWNAGLAVYHAGVEWKLWLGPAECSGPAANFGSATDLLKSLQTIHIPRCDDAAWRFLGISLAGYDVLISMALAAIAIWGAVLSVKENG